MSSVIDQLFGRGIAICGIDADDELVRETRMTEYLVYVLYLLAIGHGAGDVLFYMDSGSERYQHTKYHGRHYIEQCLSLFEKMV
jgi:hypothetical protein